MNAPRTLLIDGDPICWRASHFASDAADAAVRACRAVHALLDATKAARAIVCLSDPSRRYFRHDLLPTYKHRSSDRPACYADAVAGLRDGYLCRELPALEADDVVGILATCPQLQGERLIVGDDKDLLTIPGFHWRDGKVCPVTVDEAGHRHLLQTLIGDSGDCYPGCPGVGEKRAGELLSFAAYLASPALAWKTVVAAFAKKGLAEADALLQARLARICRHDDYDLERREVRLWDPRAVVGERKAVAS